MEKSSTYCAVRRRLENRLSLVTGKLFSASTHLMDFVELRNRSAYLTTRNECSELRQQIAAARNALREHRTLHQC